MQEAHSRFGALIDASLASARDASHSDRDASMPRLWRGFMAMRILVASVLLLLVLYLQWMGQQSTVLALAVCVGFLGLTIWVRLMGQPTLVGEKFHPQWLLTVGVDVLVFGLLLYLQVGSINFTPLFVLPVLLAAVLGSLLLALGTAAVVTLALLFDALQYSWAGTYDATSRYVQAAITGTGLFAVAYLANLLVTRLLRQEQVARGSELAARTQIKLNQLVIDNLGDGIIGIDANGMVHAANPSAREMIGANVETISHLAKPPFALNSHPAWQGLADLAAESLHTEKPLQRELTVFSEGQPRHLLVQTYLSGLPESAARGNLCVMFMEDLREVEARVRTEKLAAMGRMSAAVAHEIRNPLSAISQANELLAEEIRLPEQQNLVRMVAQNVQRLNRVVEDVLDVSRVQVGERQSVYVTEPGRFMEGIFQDWLLQNKVENIALSLINKASIAIEFEADHLRRVLVNLLDNALRHASRRTGAIQVSFASTDQPTAWKLSVWSDGAPIDPGVRRHMFEPFFSSHSRSSGLGLYICRELCVRHGASLSLQRNSRIQQNVNTEIACEGNDFSVIFRAE